MASSSQSGGAGGPKSVGWIGLGSMGSAMAKNVQKHLTTAGKDQPPLRVYNRTASRCAALEELGAKKYESIAELARDSDIVFISSSADDAVISIVDQIVQSGDATGKVVVDTTTVHPDTTRAVAATLKSKGAHFAAMPVFGATPVAEAGQLLAGFAGPDAALGAVSPLLKGVIAREVLVVGQEPEKASLLKTTGNLLMASLMQIIAEAHVFAAKTGLPEATLERLLELNFGPVMHSDSIRMTTGVYCPGPDHKPWSDLQLAIKDVGHGVEIAEREGVSLHVGQRALGNLKKANEWRESAEGGSGRSLDSSSVFGVVRQESGLGFETEFVKARDDVAATAEPESNNRPTK
ncbi:NAD binding domain of 6-phosphogluconate dehydrogenase-domain-containing protein [Apiospora arundinis]|uniref:NAD binding domain of 6-phosphogluconate dehydrogenase-domain-containing protein n=1 Tax=Apiospora arundinis TaxID=335852 RepID=A0ABR2I8T9_9PEZI